MKEFFMFLLGLIAGGLGYLIVTFHFTPIIRYLNTKHDILSDLIFFANATNAEGLNEKMKERLERRIESNRRHSSELTACYFDLPFWYKKWLEYKNENPQDASTNLMGLSNTFDFDVVDKRVEKIKKLLRFDTKVI